MNTIYEIVSNFGYSITEVTAFFIVIAGIKSALSKEPVSNGKVALIFLILLSAALCFTHLQLDEMVLYVGSSKSTIGLLIGGGIGILLILPHLKYRHYFIKRLILYGLLAFIVQRVGCLIEGCCEIHVFSSGWLNSSILPIVHIIFYAGIFAIQRHLKEISAFRQMSILALLFSAFFEVTKTIQFDKGLHFPHYLSLGIGVFILFRITYFRSLIKNVIRNRILRVFTVCIIGYFIINVWAYWSGIEKVFYLFTVILTITHCIPNKYLNTSFRYAAVISLFILCSSQVAVVDTTESKGKETYGTIGIGFINDKFNKFFYGDCISRGCSGNCIEREKLFPHFVNRYYIDGKIGKRSNGSGFYGVGALNFHEYKLANESGESFQKMLTIPTLGIGTFRDGVWVETGINLRNDLNRLYDFAAGKNILQGVPHTVVQEKAARIFTLMYLELGLSGIHKIFDGGTMILGNKYTEMYKNIFSISGRFQVYHDSTKGQSLIIAPAMSKGKFSYKYSCGFIYRNQVKGLRLSTDFGYVPSEEIRPYGGITFKIQVNAAFRASKK